MILAVADDSNETVRGILHQIADDATSTAVHDAGPHYNSSNATIRSSGQHLLLVRRSPGGVGNRIERRVLFCRPRGFADDPNARCVDEARAISGVRTPQRCANQGLDRLAILLGSVSRGIERGVNDDVARPGRPNVIRLLQIAEYWMNTAARDPLPFLWVADQRRHLVTSAQRRVQYGRSDVTCGSGQKDAHRGALFLVYLAVALFF